jgi:hypothetical protein
MSLKQDHHGDVVHCICMLDIVNGTQVLKKNICAFCCNIFLVKKAEMQVLKSQQVLFLEYFFNNRV